MSTWDRPVKEQIDLCVDLSPVGELDVTAGVHKYGYRANWKFQIENSMDGYHPNFVHQTFFDNIKHRTGKKSPGCLPATQFAQTRDLGNGHALFDFRPYNKANGAGLACSVADDTVGQCRIVRQ